MKDSDRGKDGGMRGDGTDECKKVWCSSSTTFLYRRGGGGGANDPGDLSKTTQAICLNNF